jgi:hypothetical protein
LRKVARSAFDEDVFFRAIFSNILSAVGVLQDCPKTVDSAWPVGIHTNNILRTPYDPSESVFGTSRKYARLFSFSVVRAALSIAVSPVPSPFFDGADDPTPASIAWNTFSSASPDLPSGLRIERICVGRRVSFARLASSR